MRGRALALLFLWVCGCSCDPDAALDAGVRSDAGRFDAGRGMDASTADAGTSDAGALDAGSADAGALDAGPGDAGPRDAGPRDAGPRDAGPRDAGVPVRSDTHVHIYVSNTCVMTVSPTEITIPSGQTAYFDWHNHSADYPVDVWMSYGGGYTDLPTGSTWDEPIGHCSTPFVGNEYADISTACSSFRFLIHCN